MVKIYRRACGYTYRTAKKSYKYYRFNLPIPATFKDTVKPFLNKDLAVEIKVVAVQQLLIIMAQEKPPVEIFQHTKKPLRQNS